jgi:hypothetical protein
MHAGKATKRVYTTPNSYRKYDTIVEEIVETIVAEYQSSNHMQNGV